jgi:hypothetical protein
MVHSDDLVAHISAQRSSGRAAKVRSPYAIIVCARFCAPGADGRPGVTPRACSPQSRRLVVAALSTCLVASAGLFAARR